MGKIKTLQYGSQGDDVRTLQQQLNKNGANLKVDGIFGKNTQDAVLSYQKQKGLAVDGIVGQNTQNSLLGGQKTILPLNGSGGNTQKDYLPLNTGDGLQRVNYSGNATGGGSNYTPTAPPSTSSYSPMQAPTLDPLPTAPTYDSSNWDESEKGKEALDIYNAIKGNIFGTYNPETGQFEGGYGPFVFSNQDWMNDVLGGIKNYGEFSYDVNSDALYQQYAEQYARMGKTAMQDTMGQAAAMTGGYGNSYASTAGNQAYQSYLQQLNDKVPELYKLALDRYQMGKQDLYNQYGLLLSEYEKEYGLYSDEYNKLLGQLGIASDDYYRGADMFHTEQNIENGVLSQGFNDAMAIWNADSANKWKQVEWDENNNRYVYDDLWRRAEWDEDNNRYGIEDSWKQKQYDLQDRQVTLQENAYEDGKNNSSSGGTSGGSGNGSGAGTGGGGGNAPTGTSGVTDSIRNKVAGFTSNTALADYLDGLVASGTITEAEADSLYAEYVDGNEKYNDDGTISYKDMITSSQGWTMVDDGGINLFGIDKNAKIKAPNGETMTLAQLRDKLKAEGMSHAEATNHIKKLQQNLGISSNWLFGW